ncbi:MAG: FCD domain-containing protein [Luteitalea sp.]|nr:FCD domain-containing protein [Luteitalea sp.]
MATQPRSSWPQKPPTTLGQWVYQAVRDQILAGHPGPGEFIREQEATAAMGVSRTPVREAFARLATEGFLERIPHRGFRVPMESFKDLLELYPIVSSLELLAGELAFPRLREEDLTRLHQINVELSDAMKRQDVRASVELNNQFHALLSERSGNRRLAELLNDVRSQLSRLEMWYYSRSERTERSIRQHDELLRMIENGNHERALDLLKMNMALTYTALREGNGVEGE